MQFIRGRRRPKTIFELFILLINIVLFCSSQENETKSINSDEFPIIGSDPTPTPIRIPENGQSKAIRLFTTSEDFLLTTTEPSIKQ